jgi:hypothetical protein
MVNRRVFHMGLLLLGCWGIILTSAQPTSGGPPPGSATDCDVGNATACIYSLGQCQVDSDCKTVLASYIAELGFTATTFPSDAGYACVETKCDLLTPSVACANIGLPTCSISPDVAPASTPMPAQASAPVSVSILPSDCYLTNSDCESVLPAYLQMFNVTNSQVPNNATFGCSDKKCDLFFPTNGCLPYIDLPTCALAPGPAPASMPEAGPIPAPVSILPSDCYVTNPGGTECAYLLGTCKVAHDCLAVLDSYLLTFNVPATQLPANDSYGCLDGQKCELVFPATGCLSEINLPMCQVAPAPAPVPASGVPPTSAPVTIVPSPKPSPASPPTVVPSGTASAPSPTPSVVAMPPPPPPPPPPASAARPFAQLCCAPLVTLLSLAALALLNSC